LNGDQQAGEAVEETKVVEVGEYVVGGDELKEVGVVPGWTKGGCYG